MSLSWVHFIGVSWPDKLIFLFDLFSLTFRPVGREDLWIPPDSEQGPMPRQPCQGTGLFKYIFIFFNTFDPICTKVIALFWGLV